MSLIFLLGQCFNWELVVKYLIFYRSITELCNKPVNSVTADVVPLTINFKSLNSYFFSGLSVMLVQEKFGYHYKFETIVTWKLSKSVFLRFLFLYIRGVCIVRWQNKHYKLKLQLGVLSRTCGPCCSLKYYGRAKVWRLKKVNGLPYQIEEWIQITMWLICIFLFDFPFVPGISRSDTNHQNYS